MIISEKDNNVIDGMKFLTKKCLILRLKSMYLVNYISISSLIVVSIWGILTSVRLSKVEKAYQYTIELNELKKEDLIVINE